MSTAQALPGWRRSLERVQRKLESLSGTRYAAALATRRHRSTPLDELQLAAASALESEGYEHPEREPSGGPEVWPWPESVSGESLLLIAGTTEDQGDRAAAMRLFEAGMAAALQAPESVLRQLGIDHAQEAPATAERWVAMLFAAAWWGNTSGSMLIADHRHALELLPEPVAGSFELADEPVESPSRVYWLTDLAAMSESLIDLLLAAEGKEPEESGREKSSPSEPYRFTAEADVPAECRQLCEPSGAPCTASWANGRFGLANWQITRAGIVAQGKLGRANVYRYRDLADLADSRAGGSEG